MRKHRILFMLVSVLCWLGMQAGVLRDTTVLIHSRQVRIQWPEGAVHGTILMLPGWNFPRTRTCEQSTICTKALKMGFVLISPEMGKSLYASEIYPNTRKEWGAFPQLKFITDTLQPFVQSTFSLLKPGQHNFIYGISTGARGGALLLENSGTLYTGAALLSGDYDPCSEKTENLLNGFYGSYEQFPERWEGPDNAFRNAGKIKAPVFLGHGKSDVVVPFSQTNTFSEQVRKQGVRVTFSGKEKMGHDFVFWESETDAVLTLFVEWGKQ